MDSLKLEVEGLKQELVKYDGQLKAVDEVIAGIEEQVKELEEAAKETKVKIMNFKLWIVRNGHGQWHTWICSRSVKDVDVIGMIMLM